MLEFKQVEVEWPSAVNRLKLTMKAGAGVSRVLANTFSIMFETPFLVTSFYRCRKMPTQWRYSVK